MNMKTIFCLFALSAMAAQPVLADAQSMAKERAKEVVNQSNVRQGIGAPAGSPGGAAAAATDPGRPLPADPVAKLKADIAAISSSASVSAEQKKQLATDMLACARGSKKPSLATVQKFSNSLSGALAGKGIETPVQSRLVQNINLALNSASLSEQRLSEVGDDVQAILQTSGLTRGAAVNLVGELKAITEEIQAAN
jgi:hypothetical protein